MALQVWLPLTKDLRNQGLDNITVTTANTNVFQNEGKLSNLSLDVSGHYAFQVPSLVKKRIFSCSFWYKPITNSSYSDNWRRIIVFDTYTSDGSTAGAIFRFESSYGYQSSSTQYCISIHNNVGEPIASIGTGLGSTDGWNQWQHITITADGTTLRCYRNGVQIASGNMGNGGMLQGTVHIGYTGNRPIGRLNDFRLYDHCLSPMEVKELAKGLVLHYPLNREGFGQENLVNNSDFSNLATTGTVIRDETVLFHGHPTCKINRTGATSNTYTGWSSQDLFSRLTPGTKVTASVWVYRENTHGIDSGCEWRMYQRYNNGASTDWTGFYSAANWPIGEWKKFTYTYTVRSDVSGAYLNFNVVKNGTYWLAEPKVEIGEKATSWSPSTTDTIATTMDLNGTIEYDISGFGNNGTRTGAFDWTSDTSKYQVSTTINSSKIQCLTNPITGDDPIFSIGFWFKLKSNISYIAYADLVSFSSSSYSNQPFRLEICGNPVGNDIYWFRGPSGNTGGFKINTSSLVRDTWYHTMLVSEGNKQYSYYINGIKTGTYNGSANSWIPTNIFSIGDGQAGAFNISNVRIYATALSADDIAELYSQGRP